jgi:N-acetylglucosamine-6-phosphate deacetylase
MSHLNASRVPPALWGRVLTDGRELPFSRVQIADGRIVAVDPATQPKAGDLRVEEGWIAPGLIDLQVNGAGGVDLTSASDPGAAIGDVARTLAVHGVTAFCPTIVSSPLGAILERLDAYRPRVLADGAESLGAHVEGPFIDPTHRGIHDRAVVRLASRVEIGLWLAAGTPAIVTLAPEGAAALEAIAQLVASRVVVSLGHSGADAGQARAGLAAGARMATHLFNGMPPLHHRRPGLVGAALASRAVLGLIADGVHVDPLVVSLVVRSAGPERVALTSDALAAAGAPAGPSVLGDQALISDGQAVYRADGTLAGSARFLDAGIRNVRAWLPDIPPGKLIDAATRTPSGVLGLLTRKGRVAAGCDADLIVLDTNFNIQLTLLRGETVLGEGRRPV